MIKMGGNVAGTKSSLRNARRVTQKPYVRSITRSLGRFVDITGRAAVAESRKRSQYLSSDGKRISDDWQSVGEELSEALGPGRRMIR